MLGGGTNGSSNFPGLSEANGFHFDNNSMPQLGYSLQAPTQCVVDTGAGNYNGNGQMPCNGFFRDETGGHLKEVLNPNPVSTGLKLSCNTDHNLPVSLNPQLNLGPELSISRATPTEIDRQVQELLHCAKTQEEKILTGIREINQRHTMSVLKGLEEIVYKKLCEKEENIESINKKNKELEERIKQVAMEAQSWRFRAKQSESVVNVLRSNLEQIAAQGTCPAPEGCGDSEVDDDAVSNYSGRALPKCRACNGKDVSVLILPCRHLSLCSDCECYVAVCPVCRLVKTDTVNVSV
ncbi:probable BOI-related E3 ubiquitin-protein ligase 2 isoform X2 [Andrographis paniculata]|uniref:probable BOI-related E3 ubiquitin-protein ligase 2 isoform X2 n=1 Tax=Andrographis paniculata TaxID=175694 RepID=UPI0021E720DD|nr:probable BOI-related E3 ubiquitin-protein ligase 2 isoform X2 [Andrographis paniculata]